MTAIPLPGIVRCLKIRDFDTINIKEAPSTLKQSVIYFEPIDCEAQAPVVEEGSKWAAIYPNYEDDIPTAITIYIPQRINSRSNVEIHVSNLKSLTKQDSLDTQVTYVGRGVGYSVTITETLVPPPEEEGPYMDEQVVQPN